MIFTEIELRLMWNNGEKILPLFPANTRFTPSALDFLKDHYIQNQVDITKMITMRKLINGLNLTFYDTGGNLPVVLLIHGFPLNKDLWQYQIGELSKTNRIIAIDLRGHGESQSTPGPYYMEMLASDCAALLDTLEIYQPVIIGGLSMGGYISLAFYRQFSVRVRGLMLFATRAVADSPETQESRDQMALLAKEKGSKAIAQDMLPKMLAPKSLENNAVVVSQLMNIMESTSVEGIIGDLAGMKIRPDSTSLLPTINKPTLIVHGIEDRLISMKEAEAMRALIPNAKLELVDSSGHLPNMEQPKIFNRVVGNFLAEVQY